jgi:hypothetical protein
MQKRLWAEVASQRTVLMGGWRGLVSIEACGDHVACSAHRDKVFTFDAADIPAPDDTFVEYPEDEAAKYRDWVIDFRDSCRQPLEGEGLRITRIHREGKLVPGCMMRHSLVMNDKRGSAVLLRWGPGPGCGFAL